MRALAVPAQVVKGEYGGKVLQLAKIIWRIGTRRISLLKP
jgi:hypothetical protein